MTELIEPAAPVDADAFEKMKLLIDDLAHSNKLRAIALCGTLPPGVPSSIYTLIATKKPDNVLIILDAYQNIECLLSGKIDILKINAEEARIIGKNSSHNLVEVGYSILKIYHVSILAITNGPNCAYLFEKNGTEIRICEFKIPSLENPYFLELRNTRVRKRSRTLPEDTGKELGYESLVINPLGAGDTCSAIFTIEYLQSKDSIQAFAKGLAAASASCLSSETTGQFDVSVQKRILELLEWHYIG
jgi:fructose-1-phosphate kinase PfkB-like protein